MTGLAPFPSILRHWVYPIVLVSDSYTASFCTYCLVIYNLIPCSMIVFSCKTAFVDGNKQVFSSPLVGYFVSIPKAWQPC